MQHMLMKVAVGIHKEEIDSAIETYHFMSQRWFTRASPTLFNAGTPRPQGLQLFNVDIIREYGTKNLYYVIDINYFPGKSSDHPYFT